jgi:putative endonuclease
MSKTSKRIKGDIGESVAEKYLKNKGFFVLERNYWKPWGEIDIVAEKDNVLRFVEVKTVTREAGTQIKVLPEENFHPAKLKRLHRAIQTYILDHKVPDSKDWMVDLACVSLDFSTKRAKVELFENIVL